MWKPCNAENNWESDRVYGVSSTFEVPYEHGGKRGQVAIPKRLGKVFHIFEHNGFYCCFIDIVLI